MRSLRRRSSGFRSVLTTCWTVHFPELTLTPSCVPTYLTQDCGHRRKSPDEVHSIEGFSLLVRTAAWLIHRGVSAVREACEL